MLEVKNLVKIYKGKKIANVRALDNVSISFNDTGMVFLLGKSGSGKSTLLNVLGGLDSFDEGEIIIQGKSSKDFKQSDFDSYRNTYLGFVFQEYNIIPEFSVQKNIELALELQGQHADKKRVEELLEQVDLAGYAKRKPNQLSGGQKQRIAIARALIKNPQIIMADEPTGALDSNTGKQIFDTLKKLSKTKLVIVVSHDREFAEMYGDRIIELKDGKVISDVTKHKKEPQKVSADFKIIGDNLIQINKGHKLNDKETKTLVELLSLSDHDVFISTDNKVNSSIKKAVRIDDNGNSEVFDSTKEEDIKHTKSQSFKLIKSRLSFRDSFKMGASGLKSKKVRLVITVLLSSIALALFGVSDTMASFNVAKSNYNSLTSTGTQSINLTKMKTEVWEDGYIYRSDAAFTDVEVNNFVQNNNNEYLLKYAVSSVKLSDYQKLNDYDEMIPIVNDVNGIFELEESDLDKYGLKVIAGKFPTKEDEFAITKVQYEAFKKNSFYDGTREYRIQNPIDMVGKQIEIFSEKFTISGVIDTNIDVDRYLGNKQEQDIAQYMLWAEFNDVISYGLHGGFFFAKGTLSKKGVRDLGYMSIESKPGWYSSVKVGIGAEDLLKRGSAIAYDGRTTLGTNDIVLGYRNSTLQDYGNFYLINSYEGIGFNNQYYSSLEDLRSALADYVAETINASCKIILNGEQYNVVGVYYPVLDHGIESLVDPDVYRNETYYFKNASCMSKVDETLDYDLGDYRAMIIRLDGDDYSLFKQYSNYLSQTDTMIIKSEISAVLTNFLELIQMLAQIFLYIGLAFAVFSALLLMNFITVSINYKKKTIGVLRALGARGSDIYWIFFNESMIITFITFVMSTIFTIVASIIINISMKSGLGVPLTLLVFGFRQIFLLLGVAILVAVVASFIPTYRISKLKPVDAINERK